MESVYDLLVVGAGPGGYVCAIRAAQLGMRVAVVEREELGGVCLNWGCIPSKTLLKNAEYISILSKGEELGFSFDNLRIDYSKAYERSRNVVERQIRGVSYLLRKNNVEHVQGEAVLRDAHTIEVAPEGRVLRGRNVVLATGARPRSIPSLPIDGETVITSRHALALQSLPSSAVIVGAGAVGVEFAHLWHSYGVDVTLVELLPRMVPNEDEEISQQLERAFTRQGINVMTGSSVTPVNTGPDGQAHFKVRFNEGTDEQEMTCGLVLVAIGVTPNSVGLGLEQVGVVTERDNIVVDEHMATNVPGIYAIGDVTGKLPLAHVASAQAVHVAEHIAGEETQPLDYEMMPRATYCTPQVASFGLTEAQAVERGHKVRVGKYPFLANGKAQAIGETGGMAKLVVDEAHGDLLGAHLVGPEVTELLAELSITRMLEGTTLELGWMVHSHPTLSEVVKEAALAVEGRAVHA